MRSNRKRRGATLIDSLVASLIALLIGGALVILVQSTVSSRLVIGGENAAYAAAQKSLNVLMDNLRAAQAFQIQSSPAVYAAIQAGSASSVTGYTDSAGDTVKFWLDTTTSPATFKETRTTGGVATTTPVLTGVQSLQFTYYVSAGAAYNVPAASWATTGNPNAPTAAELPKIGAVGISVQVNLAGYSRQLTGLVRLRNSPYSATG
jgi:hypothetical protein